MADVAWPLSLQQYVNSDSFQYQIGDTTIRSETDIGPAKVRRRFTKSVDTMTVSIWVDAAGYSTVYNLFDIDLNGGAGVLLFTHPITLATLRLRFTAPPVFAPVSSGANTFNCVMQFEVLP